MSESPLAGRTVLVTRPRDEAIELARALERRGAHAMVFPTVEIHAAASKSLDRALDGLAAGRFDWITLTSATTVDVLSSRLLPRDVRAQVAVVGEGTAGAFRRWTRREPDLVPRTFTTAALARAFPRGTGRVLCARADIAPRGPLEEALASKGWTPTRVVAYETRLPRRFPQEVRAALLGGEVEAVTFTSASTVRGFLRALMGPPRTPLRRTPRVVCIGPVTARQARAGGFRVTAVARPHTIDGLVAAVERAFARGG